MKISKKVWLKIGVFYSFILVYLLLFASFRSDSDIEPNLIPLAALQEDFYYMIIYPSSWEWKFFLIGGIFANFFILFPIPFFFDLRFKGLAKWLLVLGIPVTVEILQYKMHVGQADIDDVMLNSIGFLLGFRLLEKGWFKRFLPKSEQD